MVRLSYSSISAFNRCRRYWKYRYLDEVPDGVTSPDLIFGRDMHAALAEYWVGVRSYDDLVKASGSNEDAVRVMLAAYLEKWGGHDLAEFTTIMVEDKQRVEIAPGLVVTVVFDCLARDASGGYVLIEHKTTRSADISASSQWRTRKDSDLQTRLYALAARALGYPVNTVMFDVIRRPIYRRRDPWVEVGDNPGKFLARHTVRYSDADLAQTLADAKSASAIMNTAAKHKWFDRNGDSCHSFGVECGFYNNCWEDE